MNTVDLLQTIGYPSGSQFIRDKRIEHPELYKTARQNKIGSLYLKALADTGDITQLEDEWQERSNFHQNLQETYAHLSAAIPGEIDYAAVKSIYPFRADFKDIDLLVFDDNIDALKRLLTNDGFDLVSETPVSFDVVDTRTDVQIDVQTQLAVRRVVYLDKDTIRDTITTTSVNGTAFPALGRPADLAAIIIHSIVEQLYTLKEFYYMTYVLNEMTATEFRRFMAIVEQNKIGPACSAFFTITRELALQAFDEYPNKIDRLLEHYNTNQAEKEALVATGFEFPHRYAGQTGLRTVANKFRNPTFLKSFLAQLPHLLYPPTLYYLLGQMRIRFTRQHYAHEKTYE